MIGENSSDGYILEVDLEYPDELHYLHNDYPLASEKIEISNDTLSNYCSNIANKYGIKVGGVKKLIPIFGNKSKYVDNARLVHDAKDLKKNCKQTKFCFTKDI